MAEVLAAAVDAKAAATKSTAKQVTLYKTTDGTLFDTLEQADMYQAELDDSGKNPAVREAFFASAKGLPKYGKRVEKSLNEFVREEGKLTPWAIIQDLALNYPDAGTVFGKGDFSGK